MTTVDKTSQVNHTDSPGLIENMGYGFSVYIIGRISLGDRKGSDLAKHMAAVLPEGTTRSTVVQLVQVIEPHIPLCCDSVPLLLMVVWGSTPADKTNSVAEYVNTELKATQDKLAELVDGDFLEPEDVLTYEKLANNAVVNLQAQKSKTYRSWIAARMLRASGLCLHADKPFTQDRTHLICELEATTVDMYPDPDDPDGERMMLCNDFNKKGGPCACVYHGATRGTTLFRQVVDKGFHNSAQVGGPTSGYSVFSPVNNQIHPTVEMQTTEETMRLITEKLNTLPVDYDHEALPKCVAIGGKTTNATDLCNYSAWDKYMKLPESTEYEHGFNGYTAIRCRSVATVLPTPLSTNGMIYGCLPHSISTLLAHKQPFVKNITLENTQANREALASISKEGKSYCLMNENTAVMGTIDSGKTIVVAWCIPCDLLEDCV